MKTFAFLLFMICSLQNNFLSAQDLLKLHPCLKLIEPEVSAIMIQPLTPFFSDPAPCYKNLVYSTNKTYKWKVIKQARYSLHTLFDQKYTPLVREIDFYLVSISEKQLLWVSTQLEIWMENPKIVIINSQSESLFFHGKGLYPYFFLHLCFVLFS